MMNRIDWATYAQIATCLASIVALLGIGFLIWQVWEARRALNVNTCCGLFEFWMSKEWERKRLVLKKELLWAVSERKAKRPASYKELVDRFGYKWPEFRNALLPIFDFFEHLGVLVGHGGLDVRIVREYWRGALPRYWEPFEEVINDLRERQGDPRILENFERLYREMKDC
jgi:hypothetical protein